MSDVIVGRGSSSGGTARAAVEDPNTLRSKSFATTIDLLGEGQWEEFRSGKPNLNRIYLDEVPIVSSDGTENFAGYTIEVRDGSLDQSRMAISNTIESVKAVGVELLEGVPIETVVSGVSIDSLRVTVSTPRLSSMDPSTGDVHGNEVKYKIEYNSSDNLTFREIPGYLRTYTTLKNPSTLTGYNFYTPKFDLTLPKSVETYGQNIKDLPCVIDFNQRIGGGPWATLYRETISRSQTWMLPREEYSQASVVEYQAVVSSVLGGKTPDVQAKLVLSEVYAEKQIPFEHQQISGKATATYEQQTSFRITGTSPFIVRCTRLSPNSDTDQKQSKLYFSAVTAVQEEKLSYPGSVLCGLQVDASQFKSIPSRAYKCKMLRVLVPNNYDPYQRTYTGVWLGREDMKMEWTDNPAWCFYDLLTNTRYGLGDRISPETVDVWELYKIAQYCDGWNAETEQLELLPDGKGGFEPRFTCNLYIQTREEAYKIITDMATVFRGMSYWGAGSVIPVQDSPKEPKFFFNNTNVKEGNFQYQSSHVGTRFNAVTVTWNNPLDFYRQATTYVEDINNIAKLGYINATSTVAFGCTSESMARRAGEWILYTNSYDTDVVSFTTGAVGALPRPGDIFRVEDTLRSLNRLGGRVLAHTSSTVLMDAPFFFEEGKLYTLSVVGVDGVIYDAPVINAWGSTASVCNVDPPFPVDIAQDSVFVLASNDIPTALFRTLSVIEKEPGVFDVAGVTHNPSKYAYIEREQPLKNLNNPIGLLDGLAVESVVFDVETLSINPVTPSLRLLVGWTAPKYANRYIIRWKPENGNWESSQEFSSPGYALEGLSLGAYSVVITSINALGKSVDSKVFNYTLSDALFKEVPDVPSGITCFLVNDMFRISWVPALSASPAERYEVRVGGVNWQESGVVGQVATPYIDIPKATKDFLVFVKSISQFGVYSTTAAMQNIVVSEVVSGNAPSDPISSISGSLPIKVTFPIDNRDSDIIIEVLRPKTVSIVNYEMRAKDSDNFATSRLVGVSDSRNIIRVPFQSVIGGAYTIKGLYAPSEGGGYTLDFASLSLSYSQLAPVTDIDWSIDEPALVLRWDATAGASEYFLFVEEGGVTRFIRQTGNTLRWPVPKFELNVRILAANRQGSISQPFDKSFGIVGTYRQNEIANVPINFSSGKFIGMGYLSSVAVEHADLLGPSSITIPITDNNSATLLSFGYNIPDVLATAIADIPAEWFKDDFWRSGTGYYESNPVDLGAINTGVLKAFLNKIVEHHGKEVDIYDQVAAEYLAEYTSQEVANDSAFLTARLFVTSGDPSTADWIEAASGDTVTCRYVKVVVESLNTGPLTRVRVTSGGVTLDVPDKTFADTVTLASSNLTVPVVGFNNISAILASPNISCKWWITNKTNTSFRLNTDTFPVTMDYFIKGY